MKLTQLSVFLENTPGAITSPCRILANAGINLVTLSVADTREYGILRIIVRDWERARQLLEQSGCVVKTTEVVAIEVQDTPGGLLRILDALERARINVEYIYAFAASPTGKAVLVFRFSDPDAALGVLQSAQINIVDPVALFAAGAA